MPLARSKVTSRGRTTVPAEVRKQLGIELGSLLQWDEENGTVVIRRVGQFSSEEVHAALFPERPKTRSLGELKASIGELKASIRRQVPKARRVAVSCRNS